MQAKSLSELAFYWPTVARVPALVEFKGRFVDGDDTSDSACLSANNEVFVADIRSVLWLGPLVEGRLPISIVLRPGNA